MAGISSVSLVLCEVDNIPLTYIADKPFNYIHEKYISTDELYLDLEVEKIMSTWWFILF